MITPESLILPSIRTIQKSYMLLHGIEQEERGILKRAEKVQEYIRVKTAGITGNYFQQKKADSLQAKEWEELVWLFILKIQTLFMLWLITRHTGLRKKKKKNQLSQRKCLKLLAAKTF